MVYIHFIGIDVSKEWFDAVEYAKEVAKAAKPERFQNSSAGFAAFARRFAVALPRALIVLEATGGYESALVEALLDRGWAVHRADPRAASHFIRSLGKRAKTDGLDARALARYGAERHGELRLACPQDAAQAELEVLHARRADLVAMRTAEKNRLKHPRYSALREDVRTLILTLQSHIDALEARIEALIGRSRRLAARRNVLTAVTGVGTHTANSLLACMPQLGTLTRRQAASLAGCAPHPRDSGKTTGYRRTSGGKQAVRSALFMAAMAARNFHPELKIFYQRLLQNGKKPIVALTALMRKLITILNAKLRDAECQTTW
jgi:transposase